MTLASAPSSLLRLDDDTIQRFREIVSVSPKFDSPQEEETCSRVLDQLSEEEIESTARISYAFWALRKLKDESLSSHVAKRIASKIIRWHVQFLGGSKHAGKVAKRVKEALDVRQKHNLEAFRTCFDEDASSEESKAIAEDVKADMEKQLQFLRGQDKEGRAVLIKIPRTVSGTTEQAYLRQQLYVAEKSAAVTEYLSVGRQDTACAIFSMENQDSSKTPPLSWQYRTITIMQQIYPGRMGKVLILEAPFMIRQIFGAIKPMLSKSLRESTDLVSGKTKIKRLEETLEEPKILTSYGDLAKPLDIEKYLYKIPFHCPDDYQELDLSTV